MTFGQRALTTVFRRVWLYRNPLSALREDQRLSEGMTLRPLEPTDLNRYAAHRGMPNTGVAEARLRQGEECYAVWRGGEILHTAWIATGRGWIKYLDRWMILEPDQGYVFDAFTSPCARGRGLPSAKYGEIWRVFVPRGIREFLAVVAVENQASIRSTEKAGGRIVGSYYSIRLGPWNHAWAIPAGDRPMPRLASCARV